VEELYYTVFLESIDTLVTWAETSSLLHHNGRILHGYYLSRASPRKTVNWIKASVFIPSVWGMGNSLKKKKKRL